MSLNIPKDDSVKFRIDAATAELMERARGYVTLDKSKFVRHSIREKAEAIIAQHEKSGGKIQGNYRFSCSLKNWILRNMIVRALTAELKLLIFIGKEAWGWRNM